MNAEHYILAKRFKPVHVNLARGNRVNELKKYRNFVKINRVDQLDSAFIATSREFDDGIDFLEASWRITDKDLACHIDIDFTMNNPRHSNVYYYYLGFDAPCLNVKTASQCKDDDMPRW